MTELITSLLIIVGAVFIFMSIFFFIGAVTVNNGVVDIAWGLGFVLIVIVNLFTEDFGSWRLILISILIAIWGLRLAGYLGLRLVSKKEEDFRYQEFRRKWQPNFLFKSFTRIYILQGFLMLLICSPVIMVRFATYNPPLGLLDYVGVAVWIVGFFFETVGDIQMHLFKSKPENKGKIMTSGLWRFTRHPNYFGEIAMWWGIGIIGLSSAAGPLTFSGALLITYLLIYVSGIPMLEKKYENNPEFQEYAKRTSVLIPMLPKS